MRKFVEILTAMVSLRQPFELFPKISVQLLATN